MGEPRRLEGAREVLEHYVMQVPRYPAALGPTDLRKDLLGPDALGNVVLHPDEVCHAPLFVPHGVDAELVPEQGSILAVVPEHDRALSTFADRGPQFFERRLVAIFALQETAIAT